MDPEVLLGYLRWNSLREESVVWTKNSPTVESFKINLKRTSSVNGS